MEKKFLTTCPYCGAGCQFYLVVDQEKNQILRSEPANGRQTVEQIKVHFA